MSDTEHPPTSAQPKNEGEAANITINIKVRKRRMPFLWGVTQRDFVSRQVVSSSGEEVFFKIKRTTKLSKLQGAYANKVGKDVSSIRWVIPRKILAFWTPICCCQLFSQWPLRFSSRIRLDADLNCPDRFLYDGARINDDDTPDSLDMEDNGASKIYYVQMKANIHLFTFSDTIDVMVEREWIFSSFTFVFLNRLSVEVGGLVVVS